VELETILAPISLNGGAPTRFIGMVQMLSDPAPLLGRSIAYQRLAGSQMIQEDEPLPHYDQNLPPPPPPAPMFRSHPKAPYLRLVTSQDGLASFGSGDLLQKMVTALSHWHAANSDDYSGMA